MEVKILDFNKLDSEKKKSLSTKKGLTFVVGGREMSKERVKNLIEKYGQDGGYLLFGVLKEAYIPELEFDQFKSLKIETVTKIIDLLGEIGLGKVRILNHRYEDTSYVISELKPRRVVFVHGSYKRAIHLRGEYWKALDVEAEIKMESPFMNEKEARSYERKIKRKRNYKEKIDKYKIYTDEELVQLAGEVAKRSFDWIYPIGAVLAKKGKPRIIAHNAVLPFETYSALHGSLREINRTPAGDQNFYDTNHAEMEILEQARRRRIGLRDKTLYLNVSPCPQCARVLSRTELSRIVFASSSSEPRGIKLLEESGIKVEQLD